MHILHTLTDTICDSDVPVVNIIEDETENLEEEVYGQNTIEENQNLLQKIGIAKRRIVRFRQLLWPKKDILMSLVQKENFDFLRSQINVAYFRDVYDHLVLMVQKLDADHEAIAGLEATHLARVSIEVSKVSNSMNQVMKQFSSVATIILPLSFITSLLGMNVPIPYQSSADYDSLAPFTVLSVLMISLVFFMIAFFRKKKWI
jgi:Mg2+ and Co2+ transporter CorA